MPQMSPTLALAGFDWNLRQAKDLARKEQPSGAVICKAGQLATVEVLMLKWPASKSSAASSARVSVGLSTGF